MSLSVAVRVPSFRLPPYKRHVSRLSSQPRLKFAFERAIVEHRKEYKKHHALLKRLEEQGLVDRSFDSRQWTITKVGRTLLARPQLKELIKGMATKGGVTMVSYDVPERFREGRDRLREMLKLLDFEPVQKSVWFAPKKITPAFLAHLRELKLVDFVQIFEVSKTGSLKRKG